MNKFRETLPDYATPSEGSVSAEVLIDNKPLEALFAHWHQGLEYLVSANFHFEMTDLKQECNLSEHRQFLFGLEVYSTHTKKRFSAVRSEVELGEHFDVELPVPAFETGGSLEITAFVSVRSDSLETLNEMEAPDHAILWHRSYYCELEGMSGRVAVNSVDFKAWGEAHRTSFWRIISDFPLSPADWLDAEINSCLEIKYNELEADFIHSPKAMALLTANYLERLIDATLSNEGVLQILKSTPDDQLGTLGLTSKRIVNSLFPNSTEEAVRQMWTRERDSYVNRLQGMAGAQA